MASLIQIASRARDLYNQDYPDRVEFFDEGDFKFHAAAKYSEMLNALYQAARKDNKMEYGFSAVEIPSQWLISQKVVENPNDSQSALLYDEESKRWYTNTLHPIFSFDFDAFGNGLNDIRPTSNTCHIKKISSQDVRFYDILPTTPDVYCFIEGKDRIEYLKKPPLPHTLYYIPQVLGANDSCVMSDNIVPQIIMATLQLMFGAKQGNVIPEANDGNSNENPQQQSNPILNKAQALG